MIRLQFQSSPVVQFHNLPLSCPGLDFEDCSSLLWHSLVWDTQVSVPGSHMFRLDSDVLFSHWLSLDWFLSFLLTMQELRWIFEIPFGCFTRGHGHGHNIYGSESFQCPPDRVTQLDRVTCCSDVANIGSGCWHIFCPTSRLHWSQRWLLGQSPAATRLCACGCIHYASLEPDHGTGCA